MTDERALLLTCADRGDQPPVSLVGCGFQPDDEQLRRRLIGEIMASLLWSFGNG